MGINPAAIGITRADPVRLQHIRVWTDDFSDLLSLLKPLHFHFQQ
jgi:hypothetical protein